MEADVRHAGRLCLSINLSLTLPRPCMAVIGWHASVALVIRVRHGKAIFRAVVDLDMRDAS